MHNFHGKIKQLSSEIGFSACGFTSIKPMNRETATLNRWLANGCNGNMSYMENYIDKRHNPSLLLDDAKSAIVVLLNYYPERKQKASEPQISYYAYGNDYHYVMKSKLSKIAHFIEENHPSAQCKICCDSAPVFERSLAEQAGIGWIGKSGMLVNPSIGSFTFIGIILTTLELPYDSPMENMCGTCHACVDACPTAAILADKTIDARRCISYQTIENRSETPIELETKFGNRLYGCDECLKACPYNQNIKPHSTPEFQPSENFWNIDWNNFTRSTFKHTFPNSAMQRAGYKKIKIRLGKIIPN